MALALPTLRFAADGAVTERSAGWPDGEVASLGARARALRDDAEVVVPLDAAWAAGRRTDGVTRFARLGPADLARVGGTAAWLWTHDAWLGPGPLPEDLAAPAALPLRHLARAMSPVGGRQRRAVKALAAAVAALRAGGPVTLVAGRDVLGSVSRPARPFVLALLSTLPAGLRNRLSVVVGGVLDPGPYDLRLLAAPTVDGAQIDLGNPPDEGDDLVAYFVRNRLYADDPEAIESAAWLYDGPERGSAERGDRWGAGVASRIREGLPGVSELEPGMLENDPERAVRGIAARIRAGSALEGPLLEALLLATRLTRDPRPWRALAARMPVERGPVLDAALAGAGRPPAELLEAFLRVQAPSSERWLPALLGWLGEDAGQADVLRALEATLADWPVAATRASVWTEAVATLVRAGAAEAAMDALSGPMARRIAEDGAGRALAAGWATVPVDARDPARLARLVDLLDGVPDGDRAVGDLWRLVRGRPEEAAAVRDRWLAAVLARPVDPRDTLVAGAELPVGLLRAILLPALRRTAFPDPEIAAVCERVARAEGGVWGFVAVAAAAPGTFSDEVVDGTVVELLGHPDAGAPEVALAAERLGGAIDPDPLEHARWFVRLVLGGAPGPVVDAFARGLRGPRQGAVLAALDVLGPDHPAGSALRGRL